MTDLLFDIAEIPPVLPTTFCRTCVHRQRWKFGESVFQYCGTRKNNLTSNGLLKIKCKTPACGLYKEDKLTKTK